MTKKELLLVMNNKKVKKTVISGVRTVEDNEALKKSIIDSLEDNGKTIDDFVEDENTYSINGFSNFWFKSKIHREEIGILKIRSKDYIFNDCYGDIPTGKNFIMLENGKGFISVNGDKKIKYELENREV